VRKLRACSGDAPTVSTAKGATTKITGIPFKLSGVSGQVRAIAPEVGENND
jgi:hypothetical protein